MKNWVTIPRKNAEAALAWARLQHSYITNVYSVKGGRLDAYDPGNDPDNLDFFFTTCELGRKDMTFFALKWA